MLTLTILAKDQLALVIVVLVLSTSPVLSSLESDRRASALTISYTVPRHLIQSASMRASSVADIMGGACAEWYEV